MPVTCDLQAGGKFIVTEEGKGTIRELSVLGCVVGSPKSERKGHEGKVCESHRAWASLIFTAVLPSGLSPLRGC